MPISKILALLSFLLLVGCENNQFTDVIADNWIKEPIVCADDTTAVIFKKIAYWSPDESENIKLVQFSSLTHVNYASITFNADGTLNTPEDTEPLIDLVTYAQAENVKVSISIGEWGDVDDSYFNTIATDKTLTKIFVSNLSDFIEEYALDGVDVNWQTVNSEAESERLKYLLEQLYNELNDKGKLLTMTVPSGEDEAQTNQLSTDVFAFVDFINVIAFDSTNSDSLHSSLQDAMNAISYWTDRCVIKNKLVLGVPFYSDGDAVRSYDYLIRDDISYACTDKSESRNYNGIPTVVSKTQYALSNAGGVMMKSLQEDVYQQDNDNIDYSEYSLVNVIKETALGNEVTVCQ